MGRDLAALELGAHRLPGDEVADGVALVEGVHQVADLDAVPDEWALEFGYCDAVALDVNQQLRDRGLRHGVLRHT